MNLAALIVSLVALIASGASLYLVYQATGKLVVSHTQPCHQCSRPVVIYKGQREGPHLCHMCQIRKS